MALQLVATRHDHATFGQGVGQMAADFVDRCVFNQWALHDTFIKPVAHFEGLDLDGELGDKFVVDAFLHIKPIGTDAGLTGVAVFA